MLTGVASATYRRELDEYLDVHHRLYEAVAAVSGADVVVDASKSTAQLFALRRIRGLDLRVVNLVRDSRGVANSWNKSGIVKPQSQGRRTRWAPTPRTGWPCSGPRSSWSARCCGRPRRTRRGCGTRTSSPGPGPRSSGPSREVGLPPADRRPGPRRRAQRPPRRPATGSPAAGPGSPTAASSCELDDAWRSTLPAGARRVVTAVTLPLLVGYGYVGRATARRHGPRPPDGDRPRASCRPPPCPAAPPRPAVPQARLAARRALPRASRCGGHSGSPS